MRRGVIAGVGVAILGGIGLWTWMSPPHDAVVLAQTRRTEAASPAASVAQGGAWALLAEATRQADAAEPQGRRFCGAPFMDEGPKPTPEMYDRMNMQFQDVAEREARRLANAPDELGRLASAILLKDPARIAQIASDTRDPVVYGLALEVCEKDRTVAAHQAVLAVRSPGLLTGPPEPPPPQCASMTASRWTDLDPDNASAWWLKAAREPSSAEAFVAMTKAKAAPHTIQLRGQLFKRIGAEHAHDTATLLALYMITAGREAALPWMHMPALEAACPKASRDDPDRGPKCQELAIDVLDRQVDVGDKLVMRAFAARMGVPEERLPQSRDALRALYKEIDQWRGIPRGPEGDLIDCRTARRITSYAIESTGEGDISAYRRLSQAAAAASAASASPKREPG